MVDYHPVLKNSYFFFWCGPGQLLILRVPRPSSSGRGRLATARRAPPGCYPPSPAMPALTLPDYPFLQAESAYHPGLSVDCVIFGFHGSQLNVLLLKLKHDEQWMLAGGFVRHEEDVAVAASRVLQARTGLTNLFLRQFYLFGDAARINQAAPHPALPAQVEAPLAHWLSKRFVSVGYYALVDFVAVQPQTDQLSEDCAWWDLAQVPPLILDHAHILDKALETLRLQLRQEPIGYNLLPEKSTMPELQKLYEAILGRALDRRNFQRKILSYGFLRALDERRQGAPRKAPRLFSFHLPSYQRALEQGLQGGW